MPQVGFAELIVVFMILLLVFGGSRLPQIGESVGKALRGFKRGIASDDAIEVTARDKPPAAKVTGAARGAEPADADLVDKG